MFNQSILIVDDHRLFAEGMRSLLTGSGHVSVDILTVGSALMDVLKEHCPALLLLDISIDDTDGIALVSPIKKTYPVIKILIVSMHARRVYIEKALQAGVDGYIVKNAGDDELKTAVATILEGGRFFSAHLNEIFFNGVQASSSPTDVTLTSREKETLQLIADGYSTKEIADRLFVSINTIETHRKNMLFKTGLRNMAHLIKWAFENNHL